MTPKGRCQRTAPLHIGGWHPAMPPNNEAPVTRSPGHPAGPQTGYPPDTQVARTRAACRHARRYQRMGTIDDLSTDLAEQVSQTARFTVGIHTGHRPRSGILWRPDVVVVSEQMLPDDLSTLSIVRGGQTAGATLAGRDPSTNVA